MVEEKNFNWTNWAGNHSCIAENYFEPETEAQIIEVIQFAGKHQKKIRVVGSGHSFSPIAISNEILVSLKNYRKLVSVGKDSISCQGGMYLHELYSVLKENKLSLSNFGVINKQTVAGALATGTHGSSLWHKSLSAEIESLRIITASGEVLEINRDTVVRTGDKELNLWEAASISLGMFGIISEVTFRCEPLFYLKSEESVVEFDEFIDSMDDYARRYEYFKAWWFPHTNKVYLFKTERIGEELYKEKDKLERFTNEQKMRDLEIDALTAPMFIKSNHDPSLIPGINTYCLDYFFTPRTRIGNSFEILVHDETVPMVVSEYGLSVLDNNHKKALTEFRDTLEHSDQKIHFPVDLRYTGAESSWLSPSYNQDTFYIGMCVREYREKEVHSSMQLFFDVMKKYNASPNWGKLSDLSKTALEERYPGMNDFRQLRNSMDPNGVFQNEFIKNFFFNLK
ncbi:L-gulonolactone oxidase [Chitinophaga sp. CF118]|uniref:D-arabinono-1,4-lactone oxidase n=1 Tax=Chitinophaga sp. CF118 TaxID=1884367 RepID=UPI0008E96F74|nr:D-arabinono-1,4-lactone oxidase [Chitinophaga sp. CF118]SFD87515.1 L-gulonolactone oxidase [Chitinophaga sp. CF118]